MLNNNQYFSSIKPKEAIDLVINILAYLTHSAIMDDEEILTSSCKILSDLRMHIDDYKLVTTCSILSRHFNVPESFWAILIDKLDGILKKNIPEFSNFIYSTYLNLHGRDSKSFEVISEIIKPYIFDMQQE